jgi:hypothetical protein
LVEFTESAIIRREAMWLLSNIFAGTVDQVCEVLTAEDCRVLPMILFTLQTDGGSGTSGAVAREALWCVLNIFGAHDKFWSLMEEFHMVDPICRYFYTHAVVNPQEELINVTLTVFDKLWATSLTPTSQNTVTNLVSFLSLFARNDKVDNFVHKHCQHWTKIDEMD